MRFIYSILVCVTVGMLPVGCERAPSKDSVVGTYLGSLNGASEVLVLRQDGMFSQELRLPSSVKLSGEGTWSLDYKKVTFDQYLVFYDCEKDGALIEPKMYYRVNYKWGAGMLICDWDSGYYTLKHQ